MFYYLASKKPKIEVSVTSIYKKSDLEKIFLFLDALIDSPLTKVIFIVHFSVLEEFTKTLLSYHDNYLYEFKIIENAA
ncbi:hypothetical protein BAA08_08675 [Bizionia sp. APA-3]|nr:hypothetical protein BAA08_08675 [Bizionia sp. APA-3]